MQQCETWNFAFGMVSFVSILCVCVWSPAGFYILLIPSFIWYMCHSFCCPRLFEVLLPFLSSWIHVPVVSTCCTWMTTHSLLGHLPERFSYLSRLKAFKSINEDVTLMCSGHVDAEKEVVLVKIISNSTCVAGGIFEQKLHGFVILTIHASIFLIAK